MTDAQSHGLVGWHTQIFVDDGQGPAGGRFLSGRARSQRGHAVGNAMHTPRIDAEFPQALSDMGRGRHNRLCLQAAPQRPAERASRFAWLRQLEGLVGFRADHDRNPGPGQAHRPPCALPDPDARRTPGQCRRDSCAASATTRSSNAACPSRTEERASDARGSRDTQCRQATRRRAGR